MHETKPARFISFRDQATGQISDLLADEGLRCAHTQDLLGFLTGALLSYREEGEELTPIVVVCESVATLRQTIPGGIAHQIGQVSLDANPGPKILKDCAPLSGPNWFVYIERLANGRANYGVFTYLRSPTGFPLDEALSLVTDQLCVLARRTGPSVVELRGAKGHHLAIAFSTMRARPDTDRAVKRFAHFCSRNVIQPEFEPYFTRVLTDVLAACHGTMFVCSEADVGTIPSMKDAVTISPELDFASAFSELEKSKSADSILVLQRTEELLRGFVRCDGMVVFDTRGRISAYRAFYRPEEPQKKSGGEIVGGARRRAYEELKNLVGKTLISVLFRSQDGQTLQHEA